MKRNVLFIICLWASVFSFAQTTQTIRGIITDKVSEKPLAGANITIVLDGKRTTVTSDVNGNYSLPQVPPGRQAINVSYVGYKPAYIPEILVTTGKQVVIDVALDQNIALESVVVNASRSKRGNVSNEFAGSSSRSIHVDEITRFAGGRNDPSKLVSNFAGVVSNSDSRNDIVVRGNSPIGVLWRIEGIPTPNPNHFSALGTTGGPVSALNTNALKTSDFYSGAFSAEYGNANAAVFDINLRTGNSSKHERTLQLNAFSGLEAMLEGPLGKKKNGASYLVGYRYSFVQIAQSAGINVGTSALPKYQDWVYNIQFAKGKWGKVNLFGLGGFSNINFRGKDIDSTDFYSRKDQDADYRGNFYVFGAKHTIDLSKKSYWRTVVSYSTSKDDYNAYQYALPVPPFTTKWQITASKNRTANWRGTSYVNTKFNSRWSMRIGFMVENYDIKSTVIDREGKPSTAAFDVQRDFDGKSVLGQAYTQLRYKPIEAITLTGGLHAMYFDLNNKSTLEPRFGISYAINNSNTLLFNYGLHSQIQPFPVYFYQSILSNGTIDRNNRNLDYTKAHHFVLGYEKRFIGDWRLKLEGYYQHLFNVPVESISSGFSMLNAGSDFTFPDKTGLVNKGTGNNAGVELTLEKFLSKGYYVLLTTSVFDSKYKGSDNIERNTTYNYGKVLNILAGKEWKTGKAQRNAFTLDVKMTTIGGKYATPVNLAASIAANKEVLDETRYNADKLASYFRLDTKFGFRINSSKKKISQTFYLDLQNVTNQKNIFLRRYNPEKQKIGEVNQIGFFPDILFKIQF